ncbi:MAG: dTDP-4-dehydrorhamnose 3,5-epimerase [Pseudomonadota bacterium]
MQIDTFDIPGVVKLTPKRFGDHRGYFSETYNAKLAAEAGIDKAFVQDNQSLSAERGTVRGLHFQRPPHAQGKLVRVLAGAILDVAVDIRHGSPTFAEHVAVELTADGGEQLWVPEGFAHAFCTLAPNTVVFYKVTGFYAPAADDGIRWDDPDLGIAWPVAPDKAVISEKDGKLPRLAEAAPTFHWTSADAPTR